MAATERSPARQQTAADQHSLTITRVFNAPRSLVWKCWTDPAHEKGWGPHGFDVEHVSGGKPAPGEPWRKRLIPRDGGKPLLQSGVYLEVIAPERLVLTFGWENERGEVENPTRIELTFEEHGGRTTMHFVQSGFNTESNRDGHHSGWTEAFDEMAGHLARIGA